MSAAEGAGGHLHDLRLRAERMAAALPGEADGQAISREEVQRLLHELLVHQIELEMQNQELARAQEEIEQSRQQFWTLFQEAPVGYVVLDGDGLLVQVNDTFARMLGQDPDRLQGKPFQELLTEGDRAVFLGRFRAFQRRPHGKEIDCRLARPRGERLEVRLNGASVDLPGEGSGRLLLTVHDVTYHKQLERQVARSQRMDSLGSLAGGVAHDMNNVLAAIMCIASVHEASAEAGSQLASSMHTIGQACVRGRALVNSLLEFSRKELARREAVDLNALVVDTVALLEHTTLCRIRILTDLTPDLHAVDGDPGALSQAVLNLCVNAVDAMPAGGTLTLATRNEGDAQVVLEVVDTGCGMTSETLERAFDPFYTTKPAGTGTGLGLAIVYSCARAHGGNLEMDSQVGVGTRVRLHLPARQARAQAPPQPDLAPTQAVASLRVLVVDDDEMVRTGMRLMLGRAGHDIMLTESGEQALGCLEAGHEADLVILDVNMPGMGGLTTLRAIRKARPAVPVLLFTGAPDDEIHRACREHARVSLLKKPVSMRELQARVVELLVEGQGDSGSGKK